MQCTKAVKQASQTILAVLLMVAIGACEQPTNPSAIHDEDSPDQDLPMFSSVTGILLDGESMSGLLDGIARDLAIAINDETTRQRLYEAINGSRYVEGKLHLGTLLSDAQPELTASMANARGSGISSSDILATLDSLIDLEVYLPVPAHRNQWKGGTNLVVAWALRDDGNPPIGWDLSGQRVRFESAEQPPDVPVLALVPVETDFSDVSHNGPEQSPGIQRAADPSTDGLHMTYANIYDDHEGFLHGLPEFEIHVRKSAQMSDISCSGADRNVNQFNYDHNTNPWTGDVMVILPSQVAGDTVQYEIWEDDSGPCTDTDGRPPKTDDPDYLDTYLQYQLSAGAIAAGIWGGSVPGVALASGAFVRKAYSLIDGLQKDDYVGTFHLDDLCYEVSGPSTYWLLDGDEVKGYVKVAIVGATASPTCALGVSMNGPEEVYQSAGSGNPYPLYSPVVEHAATGVTYEWRDNDTFKTSSSSYVMSPVSLGWHMISVKVTRTADQAVKTVTKWVEVLAEGGGGGPEAPAVVPDTGTTGSW